MGFIEALTLVLVVLKVLCKVTLSWWLIFTPMAVTLAFYLALTVIFFRKAR